MPDPLDWAPPPHQRAEFETLFGGFIIRAYLQRLLFFREPEFAFAPVEERGDAALVKTKILTENDEFFVDYEMRRATGSGWRSTSSWRASACETTTGTSSAPCFDTAASRSCWS